MSTWHNPSASICTPKDVNSSGYVKIDSQMVYNFHNQSPYAADDVTTVRAAQQVTINVLNNDVDPEGAKLTPINLGTPVFGTVASDALGFITYTPTPGITPDADSDTFTYQVRDNGGTLSNVATVNVNFTALSAADDYFYVSAPATTAARQSAGSQVANAAATTDINMKLDILDNDGNQGAGVTAIKLASQPTGGTVSTNAFGELMRDGNGKVAYTFPFEPESSKEHCFDYYNKGVGSQISNTVKVCVGQTPWLENDSFGIFKDQSRNLPVVGNDRVNLFSKRSLAIEIVQQAGKGTATPTGSGNLMMVTYTPNPGAEGSDSFTYKLVSTTHSGIESQNIATVTLDIAEQPAPVTNLVVNTRPDNIHQEIIWTNDAAPVYQFDKHYSRTPVSHISNTDWTQVNRLVPQNNSEINRTEDNGYYAYRVRGCNASQLVCGPWTQSLNNRISGNLEDFSAEVPVVTSTLSVPNETEYDLIGATPVDFRVSESGAATYNVPIAMVSGVAGVKPQMALTYSSQNKASNILGVGWSLSGQSSITRCPQNAAQDNGAIETLDMAIDFVDDRFCLNGQRLVMVSDGNDFDYGDLNSSYRMEQDNGSVVTVTAANGRGPTTFTVVTKANETHTFGKLGALDDARLGQSYNKDKTIAWHLKQVKDAYDNTIDYSYDYSDGEHWLSQVTYGDNTVTLDYKDKTAAQKMIGFQHGGKRRQNQIPGHHHRQKRRNFVPPV